MYYSRYTKEVNFMTQTISVKVDGYDKKVFEEFCASAGMSVSTAINMFIKNVNMNMELPFTVKADPFYSRENQERLQAAIAQLEAGKGKQHELIED